MKGYCHLSQVPLRAEPKSSSEMVSQLVYGESYTILKEDGEWFYVRMDFDGYEGWVSESSIKTGELPKERIIQQELFDVHASLKGPLVAPMGSERLEAMLEHTEHRTKDVIELAQRFLGVPYLWGGRTFMGIDCSGFVQIVFKCIGVELARDASQQQKQGKAVRFGELMAGDLVFFVTDFKVTHVGLALSANRIIHAHGSVRIDTLDQKGIFNEDKDCYTHHFHSVRRVR